MNKKLVIGILIFVAVLITTFLLRSQETGVSEIQQIETPVVPNSISSSANTNSTVTTTTQVTTKISKEELAKHNSLEDCWIAYNGKVYDITSYLPRHPGSSGAILPYCGSADEFERAFIKKHGTSKVNTLMKVGTFIGDFDVIGSIN